MNTAIQYLVDERGNKTAALIPIADWERYYDILRQHLELEASIKRGFEDVRRMKNGEQSITSAKDFPGVK